MSFDLKYAATLKDSQLDDITTKLGANALLRLYGGSKPASPDTAIGAQPLLAELDLSATAAPAVSTTSHIWTANAIGNGTGTAAASTGTNATFYRAFKSDGTTAVVDGTVGVTGADLNLNNINIATGQVVSVSAWTITHPN